MSAALRDFGGRAPPHDLELERAMLCAILLPGGGVTLLDEARGTGLAHDQLYGDAHQRIFDAMCAVADRGEPIDMQTVASELLKRDRLIAVGGVAYLTNVLDARPDMGNVEVYANALRDLHRKRAWLEALAVATSEAWKQTGKSAMEMIGASQSKLDAADSASSLKLTLAYDACVARAEQLAEQWDGRRPAHGIPSVLPGLQPILKGWRRKALYLLAASTGGGKSSAALQETLGIAGTEYDGEKIGCVYISLEMPTEEVIDRAFAIESGVPDDVIQTGKFTEEQYEQFADGSKRVSEKPIWFYDSPVDVSVIRALIRKADRELREHGPGKRVRFVVVDYLGLMDHEDAQRHDIALANTARALKMIAMELDVVIVALAQFNRGAGENDPWEEPQLRHLKDSSGLEQNANGVIFAHRVNGVLGAEDYAKLVVAKNRKGGKGSVLTKFNGASYRFETPSTFDLTRWENARGDAAPRRRGKKR